MLQTTNQPCRSALVLRSSLGELEGDTTASQAPVDLRVGVEPVVNATTLLLVKDDLEGLGAVLLGAEALADNLDGVDQVGQDGIVDSGESANGGASASGGCASGTSAWAGGGCGAKRG